MATKWDTVDLQVYNESSFEFKASKMNPPILYNGSVSDSADTAGPQPIDSPIDKHMAYTLLSFQQSSAGGISSAVFTFEQEKGSQRLAIWLLSDPDHTVINAKIGILDNDQLISADSLAKLAKHEAKPRDFGLSDWDFWIITDEGKPHYMLCEILVKSQLINNDNPDYWKYGHPEVLVHIQDLDSTRDPDENNSDVEKPFKIAGGPGRLIGPPIHENIVIATLIKVGRLSHDVTYERMLPERISLLHPPGNDTHYWGIDLNPVHFVTRTIEKAKQTVEEIGQKVEVIKQKVVEVKQDAQKAAGKAIDTLDKAVSGIAESALNKITEGQSSRPSPFPKEFEFIRGVMWNDDPKCQLFDDSPKSNAAYSTGGEWGVNFKGGEKIAEKLGGKIVDDILVRSHFQDLQCLHSMANKPGEEPQYTWTNIMTWIEVMYRLAVGDGLAFNHPIRDGQLLRFFNDTQNPSKDKSYRDLLTAGQNKYEGMILENRALGVIFHIIQDSYAVGHCKRRLTNLDDLDPSVKLSAQKRPVGTNWAFKQNKYAKFGHILAFHCYAGQDEDAHGHFDKVEDPKSIDPNNWDSFNQLPGARVAIEQCVRAAENVFSGKRWADAKATFEDIFKLDPDVAKSDTAVE